MKIKWFSRVFAVVMVVTMLMISCLSTAALTLTAPEVPEADDNAYAFSFEDGVLTIKVNPDKIYNMLRDGNVSRDELLEFIPEDILETLAQGRALTLDDLRALAANYITVDDLKAIVDELPTDIVREYFDLDMLPDLYLLDEIIEIIPIDDMLAAVDADAIQSLINDDVIELLLANESFEAEVMDLVSSPEVIDSLVMGDDPLLSKDVIATVFEGKLDKLVTDAVVEHLLADEDFLNGVFSNGDLLDDVLTESAVAQIADGGYLDHLISPRDVLDMVDLDEALTALEITVDDLFNDCVDPADYHDIYNNYGADFTAEELLDGGYITLEEVIAEYGITAHELIEEDVLHTQDIRGFVGDDAIKGVVINTPEVRAILKNAIDGNADVDVNDYWAYVDVQDVVKVIGSENIAQMLTEDNELFDRLLTQVSPTEVMDASGISVKDIIESAGGVRTVVGFYSTDEIKAIAAAMDKDALARFIKNDLLAAVDVKALARDIIDFAHDRYEDFKDFVKVVTKQSAKIFLAEVDYIAINGTNFYDYGMFDLNVLLNELLSALPDFDTFIQLDGDDVAASFDVAVSIRGTEYKSGVAIGYLGDPTNLNNLLESKSHLFKLDVTDDNVINVQTHTPDVLSDIYKELLESERLPASLRNKLASVPTLSVADALESFKDLPYDELQAIVDVLEGKLEPIKDKAYGKIDAAYDKVTGVPSIDNVLPENIENKVEAAIKASQNKVDSIIDAFTAVDKLEAAVNKAVDAAQASIPESLREGSLVDIYNGNGNFTAGAAVTVDVFELVNKVVTLPEELQLFLTSTEVSFGVAYDVTVDGLYGVEVMGSDGATVETILPAGLEIAKVKDLPAFAGFAEGLVDENLNPILYVPEGDVKAYSAELYSVQFVANGTVLDTIFYTYGTESVTAPIIPAEYEKLGYTVAWESFSLNQTQRLVVELDYTPIEYTATFMADGEVVDTVKFTVEDDTIAEPAVPAKLGYTGAWEEYTLGMEDITVNAVYEVIEYTATFVADGEVVGTVIFTVEDESITEPTVPAKAGYLGAWETYTLGASDITINAVYEAIEYEAVFKADGVVVDTVIFTVEDIDENGQLTGLTIPTVPAKVGYTAVWSDYFVDVTDPDGVVIEAVYTAINYTATFKADGQTVETVIFTVEDIDANGQLTGLTIPTVPAKVGYTAVWSDYFVDVTDPDDVVIEAVYDAIEYEAVFKADGQTVETVIFTVEDIDANGQLTGLTIPTVPAKVGYTAVWSDYFVDVTDPDDVVIEAVYTAINYTATFKADGQTVDTVIFTVENIDANGQLTGLTIPTVPAKVGYTAVWGDYFVDVTDPDDVIIEAVYTAINYTATFKADGQTVDTVIFTVENIDANGKLTGVTIPTVPAKVGYEAEWGTYTINAADPDHVEIIAVYDAIEYIATFIAGDDVVDTVIFTVEDIDANGKLTGLTIPTVPAKVGYTAAWGDYTVDITAPDDVDIEAVYTAIEYTATFKVGDDVIGTVKFTVEDTSITEPTVPAKAGYTGAWEEYTLIADNIEIQAKYTANVYTATFVADGITVATVTFTVEDASIAEPAVPEKAGFTGAWEEYELIADNITINAIYTAISGTTTDSTSADSKPGSTDKSETEQTDKGPVADLVDDLTEEGTFWWWILLIIAILVIIAIVLFLVLRPKDDDDDGDNTPPTAPVVEEVAQETPDTTVPTVDAVDVADADALMADDVALATVVYKEGGSTEGYKATVNLGAINDAFNDGDKVDLAALKAKGLAPAKAKRVKVLASGRLEKHGLEVEANSFSLQAIKMITLTGGTAVQKK